MDDQQALEDKDFFRQFLGFAVNKPSFEITELSYLNVDVSRAYSPFTLSNVQTKQQNYLNSPPSDDVKERIQRLSYIVIAKSLTDKKLTEDYQQLSFEGIDKKKLNFFGHKRISEKIEIDEISINYKNQRQETRFKHKTPTVIECQSVSWTGISEDFSISGLKVDLNSPAMLSAGDIVFLSFPKLQQITSQFDLKQLPYKVVRINQRRTTINLRVSVKEHQHIGRTFFRLLIEKNRKKLTTDEYTMLTPGLAEALRTIYATSLNTPTLIIQASGSRYKVGSLMVSEAGNSYDEDDLLPQMRRLSDRQGYYNLYPLLNSLHVSNWLDSQLKKVLPGDKSVSELLFISINKSVEQVEQAVITKLASELTTPELKRSFIKKSLNQGHFYSVQLKLSRSDAPEMEHLNPELSYISSYAIHRGKQIEQEICSVAGLMQLFDVTEAILMRYGLSTEFESSDSIH